MEKKIIEIYKRKFDDIRHEENGVEFWYARELMELLEYVQWRNFEKIIDKAKISCENNGIDVSDHFADVSKMIKIGKGGKREIDAAEHVHRLFPRGAVEANVLHLQHRRRSSLL